MKLCINRQLPPQTSVFCLFNVLYLIIFIYVEFYIFRIITRQISNLVNYPLKIRNIQTPSTVKVLVDSTLKLIVLITTQMNWYVCQGVNMFTLNRMVALMFLYLI